MIDEFGQGYSEIILETYICRSCKTKLRTRHWLMAIAQRTFGSLFVELKRYLNLAGPESRYSKTSATRF